MQRFDEVDGLGVVAHMAGIAGISDDAVLADDEGPRHLEHVADRLFDVMTLTCRLQPSQKGGWT